jgi:hypothetical protein
MSFDLREVTRDLLTKRFETELLGPIGIRHNLLTQCIKAPEFPAGALKSSLSSLSIALEGLTICFRAILQKKDDKDLSRFTQTFREHSKKVNRYLAVPHGNVSLPGVRLPNIERAHEELHKRGTAILFYLGKGTVNWSERWELVPPVVTLLLDVPALVDDILRSVVYHEIVSPRKFSVLIDSLPLGSSERDMLHYFFGTKCP